MRSPGRYHSSAERSPTANDPWMSGGAKVAGAELQPDIEEGTRHAIRVAEAREVMPTPPADRATTALDRRRPRLASMGSSRGEMLAEAPKIRYSGSWNEASLSRLLLQERARPTWLA